jgi:hypothetical protein
VAGRSAGVRLAEIAADDEGAQPRLGKAFRLRDAKPADHLHRGGDADALEDGAGHLTKIVALDKFRVGTPRVGLQVNAVPSTPASSMRSREPDWFGPVIPPAS